MVTTRSGANSNRKPDNLNPSMDYCNLRKRKQNQISANSESESNQTDEYRPPPNKKRKVQHQHIDTPLPQRRSTRIACKQSLDKNGFLSADIEHEEMENKETDMSKSRSMAHRVPVLPMSDTWRHRLRDRNNTNNKPIGNDEVESNKKRKNDSDYGDADFEQDLEDDIAEETEGDDAINESDPDYATRRRSQRLRDKNTIHYYNDGVDIRIGNDDDKMDEEIEKSTSLPLSLRRPKRIRKPVVNIYEVEQYKAFKEKEDRSRRQSLRIKKAVNYAESPEEGEDSGADAVGSTISPSTSRSRSYNNIYNRSRNRKRNRKRKPRRSNRYTSYSSDSSSSYSTDTLMEIREQKRIRKERRKIKPIQLHDLGLYDDAMAPNKPNACKQKHNKEDPADITPMDIDMNIGWDMVGGLEGHVQKLKEMVILPLLYPSEFAEFKMSTPRGVLFHGPPGTGKTLVARILAAQCSIGNKAKRVSFYMRKGADCLSKWVGEAERQLRLLFDEAYKNQPSVIFFDEIDGLAPVRSARQDQIHSSIVSTLLALMDGLDSRGQIIVIGATNRPDAIDPALRRPGRFDRELCFNLPSKKARKEILMIHTASWKDTNCKLDDTMLTYLSEQSVGYCGADLEALCRESFLAAVRRTYPQIYHSNVRLQIDTKKLEIKQEDFEIALKSITPSSQRSSLVFARAIPDVVSPLLCRQMEAIARDIESAFGSGIKNGFHAHYRYLIHGNDHAEGQSYLGRAVLHLMEQYPMYSLDLASLYGDSTTKCADEAILRIFKEAQRNTPSILYWPHVDRWWSAAHHILKTSIALLINDIASDSPILIVATSNVLMHELDAPLAALFEKHAFHSTHQDITDDERERYWHQIKQYILEKPKHKAHNIDEYPQLPIAALPPPPISAVMVADEAIEESTSESLIEQQRMHCVNLRVYIRSVCNRLCKHFKNFIDQMADDGVVHNNLSLFEIRQRNNERKIPTVIAFLKDIDALVQNVKDSAQTDSLKARQFINEACHLQDQALSMMSQVNRDLVKQCDKMAMNATNPNHNDNSNANANTNKKKRVSFAADPIVLNSDKAEKDDDDDDDDDEVDADNTNNQQTEEEEKEEEKEVNVHHSRLKAIINKLIKISKNYVIDEMEEKMNNLLRIIYQYSNDWDKNQLLDDLSNHIEIYFKEKHNTTSDMI